MDGNLWKAAKDFPKAPVHGEPWLTCTQLQEVFFPNREQNVRIMSFPEALLRKHPFYATVGKNAFIYYLENWCWEGVDLKLCCYEFKLQEEEIISTFQ